ncbi:hypothetical protein [Nonomuraea candida]|uniref:hypothetical protein n=1 Tax=Nonomuraea candida TaxID=359159 RepID=UPI000ACFA8DE|nr:hypothetical protein [Nonomuraea candida]
MKRILTGVALTATAALVTATPALAAAPKSPVAAVKKQLAPGKGVTFTESTKVEMGGQREIVIRRSGSLLFKKSGIAASDVTGKFNLPAELGELAEEEGGEFIKAMATPERTIKIGNTAYLSGGLWSTFLPEGETWFKAPNGPNGGVTGVYGQPLNVAEPATLKTLFKSAKATRGGYTGKVKLGDVWKTSSWLRSSWLSKPSAKAAKATISWKLEVNAAGLPTRLVSTFPGSVIGNKGSVSVDTRYSGWGSIMSIKAPTEGVATEFENGEDEISELEELNVPLGRLAG